MQTTVDPHSNFLSPLRQSSDEIVSAADEYIETSYGSTSESFYALQKKAKCSSSDDFEAKTFVPHGSNLGLCGDYQAIEDKQQSVKIQVDSLVQNRKECSGSYCMDFNENESEVPRQSKENSCLVETEVEPVVPVDETQVVSVDPCMCLGESDMMELDSVDSSRCAGKIEIMHDEKGNTSEVKEVVQSDSEKVDGVGKTDGANEFSLKIELIDEISMVGTCSASNVGNGEGNEERFMGLAKNTETNGNQKIGEQELGGNKQRRRRRGKGANNVSGINGKEKILSYIAEFQYGCGRKKDGTMRVYSRKDMEVLRYVNVEEQKKKWMEVYCGLGPDVTREYDELVECNNQKHIRVNFDPRQRLGKKEKPFVISGEESFKKLEKEIVDNTNLLDPAISVTDVDSCTGAEGECDEDDDSDEEYNSIQKPAFSVMGEPDFDSGPPEDGWEYLRRVRWEAAHIPKVKVAKLERSKLAKEQTVYMPSIPDIPKCPEHLLPLKQWEDAFLADFSELRQAFSRFESSNAEVSGKQLPLVNGHEEDNCPPPTESTILECFDKLTADRVESCEAIDSSNFETSSSRSSLSCDERDTFHSLEDCGPKTCADSTSNSRPTLSAILKMDSVARTSMLRKRINSLEKMVTLSRNDCEWLFALCLAVDTPLDADMCATLRCLLRKCASMRATKSEIDDEVVMLSVLTTISGRFFGQSEN